MILLASASSAKLAHWNQDQLGLHPVLTVNELDALKIVLVQIRPQILLLDFDLPGLDGPRGFASMRKLHPATKIIALTGAISDETELALFKTGVRGCCRSDIDPQVLKRIILAVQQGELWIRRALTHRLLDELGVISREVTGTTQTRQTKGNMLLDLTQREREIAILIGNGENNKQIARRLTIAEGTVKAHLTEIFRKLDITDRLKLALLVTSTHDA